MINPRTWMNANATTAPDWEFVEHLGGAPKPNLPLYTNCHLAYQPFLYGILRALKADCVVETGVNVGCSTYFAMHALADNEGGTLYSCDPMWKSIGDAVARFQILGWELPKDVQWIFSKQRSKDFLPTIPKTPSWDVFIHDSDHGDKTMLYELHYAWPHLREGGVLVVDDFAWGRREYPHAGTDEHEALQEFVEEVSPRELTTIGHTAAVLVK